MPKIIQRPADHQVKKISVMEEKISPSDATISVTPLDVISNANGSSPVPANCVMTMSTNSAADGVVVDDDDNGSSAYLSAGEVVAGEWNPLEEVDSALLTALCDIKERKALFRLESVLVDFMKDTTLASIDVGGAFNSVVVGLMQQSSNENNTTATSGGNEENATTFAPSHSQGLQNLQNQYQRGIRQTSFQRLILHRLADRFHILREQINNVNPTTASNERNTTSERVLVDVEGNNNNNWSAQQVITYPLGLIRLIKTVESCTPDHLLINLDLSLLVNYKNPRARTFVSNNNNNSNSDEGVRALSDNIMNGVSLDDVAAVTLTSGPKKPNKKMVIMKRNSSTNTSGSGDGLANGKREGRSRRKKLEDREKAYEEARARIFGKEEKEEAEGNSDGKGDSAAIQENPAPLSSCHSSFSVEDNASPSDSGGADGNGRRMIPSQLISGSSPKSRSASPSPESSPSNSLPASPRETDGEQKQGQAATKGGSVSKAVYRNRQEEENDPDFRRRSAYYVPAMAVPPNGCIPGLPYNMVNPYVVNPYSAIPGQHVVMQQQTHFYPHPVQITPQDPQSIQYPYSQPRVFYPAQPPQQQQTRPTEQKGQQSETKTKDSLQLTSRRETAVQLNDSRQPQKPTWEPSARVERVEVKSSQTTPRTNVVPKTSLTETTSPTKYELENTTPEIIDSRQPQTPTWGPGMRVEIKSDTAALTNTSPATTAAPAGNVEKGKNNTTIIYKEEDFPALG